MDVRFFLAGLPAGRDVLTPSDAVAATLWVEVEQGLKLCERREISAPFPVFAALRTLTNFGSFDELELRYPSIR